MADAPDVLNEHGEFGEDRSVRGRSKATGAARPALRWIGTWVFDRAEAISAEKAERPAPSVDADGGDAARLGGVAWPCS